MGLTSIPLNAQTVFIGSSIAIMLSAFIAGSLAKRNQQPENSDEQNSAERKRRPRISSKQANEQKSINESMVQTKLRTFLSEQNNDDEFEGSDDEYLPEQTFPPKKRKPQPGKNLSKAIVYYSDNERTTKFKNRLGREAEDENKKMDELYFAVFKKLGS